MKGLKDGRVSLTLEEVRRQKAKGKNRKEEGVPPLAGQPGVQIDLENIESAKLVPEW